jgi:4-amino-4-deoxy-L-arabinose transferase-like glycosyltransferase
LLLLAVVPWLRPLLRACRTAWGEAAPAAQPFKPGKFLLIYAAVTLVFFSASGSKLAPYILPMLPALAALTGAHTPDPLPLARQAARVGGVLVVIVAAGLLIYSARRNSFVPHAALAWSLAGAVAAFAAAAVSFMPRAGRMASVMAAALGASLAWQSLMCAYTVTPPSRSARALVSAVRPFVSAHTPLYSVGQYRETISPYLGRTLQLAGYEGELQFGLGEEPELRMSLEQFAARWSADGAAVAFFDPGVWDAWRRRGLPGRVIAADNYTVAVSRM